MEEGARPRVQFNVQQTGQVQGHSSPARESSFNNRSADASLSIVFSANWVRLVTPIGEGAFSRVFEGVYRNPETLDESVVAVKILKKNMLKRRSDCLRFIKEAKIMTKITNPNIAACYGIGKYDDDDPHNPGSLFIVQELIRGGNLLNKVYKQMLNRAKCVYSSQEALMWMIDVARGMTYLHAVSDVKPMIIHRDLKLENIMLSPEPSGELHRQFGRLQPQETSLKEPSTAAQWRVMRSPRQLSLAAGVVAKLVDFGLHKVIDDRIKKVVKRVISEARLGSRFNQAAAAGEDAGDCCEEGDELEMALAEQRAMTQASSVRPGVGPAASSPLGASPVARLRASPLRVTSRMTIESAGPSMHAMPEEADEEELAIQAAQAEAEEARRAAAAAAEPALERVASADRAAAQAMADASNGQKPTLHRLASSQMEGQATPNVQSPSVAIMRAPPKKQSSMAKLMAKMKEIKLRVTGQQPGSTKGSSQPASQASSASQPASQASSASQPASQASSASQPASQASSASQPASQASSASQPASQASSASQPASQASSASQPASQASKRSTLSRHASSASDTAHGSKDGVQPSSPPALADSISTPASLNSAPQQSAPAAAPAPQPSPQPALDQAAEERRQLAEKMARNHALLDRMLAQQQEQQPEVGGHSTLDQLGLVDRAAARRTRPTPRRAVTWINDVRYNLTEAVGSWAYMAPASSLDAPTPWSDPVPRRPAACQPAQPSQWLSYQRPQQDSLISCGLHQLMSSSEAAATYCHDGTVHQWLQQARHQHCLPSCLCVPFASLAQVVLGQPYNEKVDVFSFGVILFEVLNRKLMLVDEIKNDPRKDAQAYAERVARGFRPEVPRTWPETLVDLITACWAQDPHMRPNFVAVLDTLLELEAENSVGKLNAQYWSKDSAFI
ncbi:hypothetical protein QJQ45_016183 [Haematococcus lacustris]|nr:hypothetical protein QJQ45_016183 [Haematococcus lacustris]